LFTPIIDADLYDQRRRIPRRELSSPNRTPTFLFDPFLHHPPWLEDDNAFRGHHDLLAGTRIAGLASFPPTQLEDTEVAKFDSALLNERVHDAVERLFNDMPDFEL